MTDKLNDKKDPTIDRNKRTLIYAGVLALVFLLGLVPMSLWALSLSGQRDTARNELLRCRIKGELASSAIDARTGEYEPARVAASEFYTLLRHELERGNDSVFDQLQRERLKSLAATRDEMVTLLARSDPAAGERMANLYSVYRQALAGTTTPK